MELRIEHLTKQYGSFFAVNDINIVLTRGVYGLLGPNGAGKTTLMRCITGLYPCPEGTLLYGDRPIQKDRDYLSRVGYLPQKFGMFRDLTVYGALELISSLKGLPRAGTDADIRRRSCPPGSARCRGECSGGWGWRRLCWAIPIS